MSLELCPKCLQPYLAEQKKCPRCGANDYTWNQESWANMSCFLAMIFFAFLLIVLPLLLIIILFFGALVR